MESSLTNRAKFLVEELCQCTSQLTSSGSMSSAIYDTAWVARVHKAEDDQRVWVFPECFSFILETQEKTGGWPCYSTMVDGILNTAASLLAIHDRLQFRSQLSADLLDNLLQRYEIGQTALLELLLNWDIASTDNVGFEILVPALLLELEQAGVYVSFPGKEDLLRIREMKLSKFKPDMLYDKGLSTALHSLEAFIGVIDFDRVAHHKTSGSMMASPSSTAAYLMHSSHWDREAESYLRRVIDRRSGAGSGGVPSAFPSSFFELSWVITALLESGFTAEELGLQSLAQVDTVLSAALDRGKGLLGFAPSIEPDADDTARASVVLSMLDKPKSPDSLLKRFERDHHFVTYVGERNPSLSANCNVLLSLLHASEPGQYTKQIQLTARYICDCWSTNQDHVRDKWNNSIFYPTMLIAQTLTKLLRVWKSDNLSGLDEAMLQDEIPLILFQTLSRTLQHQRNDGFWGSENSFEETAYALSTIAAVAPLSYCKFIQSDIEAAVERGQKALIASHTTTHPPGYHWIEKVSYGSTMLSEAYVLGALKMTFNLQIATEDFNVDHHINIRKVEKFVPFYESLMTIGHLPKWRIRISLIEGCLFTPLLAKARFEVFPPRSTGPSEEKYWDNIRFTWCCVNSIDLTFAPIDFIVNWMKISYLNYQGDEYFEAMVGTRFSHDWKAVECVIEEVWAPAAVFQTIQSARSKETTSHKSETNGISNSNTDSQVNGDSESHYAMQNGHQSNGSDDETDLAEIRRVLTLLRDWTFTHPQVINASPYHLEQTRHEMKMWLQGHLIQAIDSNRLASAATAASANLKSTPPSSSSSLTVNDTVSAAAGPFSTPGPNFHYWTTHVSADHTSCPYAYELLLAMLSESSSPSSTPGEDLFPTAEEKYYSAALNRHLSSLCRLENDYGSIARDLAEHNLNIVHFPEFHHPAGIPDDGSRREQLLRIADYERGCCRECLGRLEGFASGNGKGLGDPKKMRKLALMKVMIWVTDSWGQMYVKRDLGRGIEEIVQANKEQLKGLWRIPGTTGREEVGDGKETGEGKRGAEEDLASAGG